jgi:hypothetical protein
VCCRESTGSRSPFTRVALAAGAHVKVQIRVPPVTLRDPFTITYGARRQRRTREEEAVMIMLYELFLDLLTYVDIIPC